MELLLLCNKIYPILKGYTEWTTYRCSIGFFWPMWIVYIVSKCQLIDGMDDGDERYCLFEWQILSPPLSKECSKPGRNGEMKWVELSWDEKSFGAKVERRWNNILPTASQRVIKATSLMMDKYLSNTFPKHCHRWRWWTWPRGRAVLSSTYSHQPTDGGWVFGCH